MTCHYHVLPEYKLGVFIASGDVTADEGVQTIKAMTEDTAWQVGFSVLWDARRISSLDVSLAGATELIKAGRQFLDRVQIARSAAVLTRELDVQMVTFLSRAISLKGTARQVKFFATLDQACEWLAVPTSVVILK